MVEMAKREILPACLKYTNIVHNSIKSKLDLGIEAPNELNLLKNISMHTEELIAGYQRTGCGGSKRATDGKGH